MTPLSTRARLGLVAAAAAALLAPIAVALPASASTTRHEIVYTADDDNDGTYTVVLRDLSSRQARTVLPRPGDRPRDLFDDPELSPRGDRIALSTDRGAARLAEGIAVIDRDGTDFRRLTTPSSAGLTYAIDVAPAWSPDGTRLLFTRITTDSRDPADISVTTALYVVPVTGGTPTRVAANGYTGDWSPDGSRIVYVALAPDADSGPVTVAAADGTGARALAGAVGLLPAWSPDGSTIAYATITGRDAASGQHVAQIATVPAAGGPVRVLRATRPGAARTVAGYPSWSPDGESLLFDLYGHSATDDFPPGDIWSVDRAGTRAGRVVAGRGDEAQAHAQGPAPTRISAGAASTFTPVTPRRVLDTRHGTGARRGTVGPAGTIDLAVRGVATEQGVVPADATAVVLNVTVTGPTSGTDVRVYPSGTAVPGTSNLNAPRGATVPNLVTVRIGANGAVRLRNASGTAHLIADLAGYYTPGDRGLGFGTVDPGRVLDTRGGIGAPARKVGAGGVVDLRVTGSLRTNDGRTVTVPADARAVVLNVTGTDVTGGATDVRVYPTPTSSATVPGVSNLNLRVGQTAANLVTVAVGSGGRVRLRNNTNSLHLVADVAGYYAPGAPGRFVPVAPLRFLDTRAGLGAAVIPTTAGAFVDLRVAGARGVPQDVLAALVNLTGTAVSGTRATNVRAYPAGAALPSISHLNLTAGETRANLTVVRPGADGRVRLRNSSGQLHLVADLAGYMVG